MVLVQTGQVLAASAQVAEEKAQLAEAGLLSPPSASALHIFEKQMYLGEEEMYLSRNEFDCVCFIRFNGLGSYIKQSKSCCCG